jgi:hypothetical protein
VSFLLFSLPRIATLILSLAGRRRSHSPVTTVVRPPHLSLAAALTHHLATQHRRPLTLSLPIWDSIWVLRFWFLR